MAEVLAEGLDRVALVEPLRGPGDRRVAQFSVLATSTNQSYGWQMQCGAVGSERPEDLEGAVEPTRQDVDGYLARTNWDRWGPDDQLGAVNLVTPKQVVNAASLVRTGRTYSLSRELLTVALDGNPQPTEHFTKWYGRETGGFAVDYIGGFYHGFNTTHMDALCHVWDGNGMWNSRRAEDVLAREGSAWGDIDQWRNGIVTRGVLLDVPRYRGEPCITLDTPVRGDELLAIAKHQGVVVEPGDALLIYSGREAWTVGLPLGARREMPGWHVSCLPVLRDWDVTLLGGDLMDAEPVPFEGLPWTVHGAISSYGLAVVDNLALEDFSEVCAEEQRYTFLFMAAPLRLRGGTGSPVNPLASYSRGGPGRVRELLESAVRAPDPRHRLKHELRGIA